jgi:hypothetical protein
MPRDLHWWVLVGTLRLLCGYSAGTHGVLMGLAVAVYVRLESAQCDETRSGGQDEMRAVGLGSEQENPILWE